jgi:hypothetical protein
MPGKFVVKKGPTGKFRFSLLSTNGQVVVLLDDAEQRARVLESEGRLANARAAATKAELDYERVNGSPPHLLRSLLRSPAAKPAAKKPAAKKPAARKPAAKKPAARR